MCKFFNSYEESLHVVVCKLAKYVRTCVVFWRKKIHSWQTFNTTGGGDKFHVWTIYSNDKYSLHNTITISISPIGRLLAFQYCLKISYPGPRTAALPPGGDRKDPDLCGRTPECGGGREDLVKKDRNVKKLHISKNYHIFSKAEIQSTHLERNINTIDWLCFQYTDLERRVWKLYFKHYQRHNGAKALTLYIFTGDIFVRESQLTPKEG